MKLLIRLLLPVITLSLLGTLTGCATSRTVTHSNPGTITTIVLTRHGDRDKFAKELNIKGQERAEALVKAVSDMKITAIYIPDYKRNMETAKPLAKHLGIEVNVVPENMHRLATTILTEHPGEAVLWVGNKINLTNLYSLLGGEDAPPTSYGDLYIMKIKDSGDPDVTKKRYGPL